MEFEEEFGINDEDFVENNEDTDKEDEGEQGEDAIEDANKEDEKQKKNYFEILNMSHADQQKKISRIQRSINILELEKNNSVRSRSQG